MSTVYRTNKARDSHIRNIERLIRVLGETSDIDYLDYREIVNYLTEYKELIKKENESK